MGNKPPSRRHRQPNKTDPTIKVVKWSNAPHDILVEISNKINSIEDYISFRQVCSSWRSAATKDNYNQSPPIKIPCLMLETNNMSKKKHRQFFSLANGKLFYQTILPKTQPNDITRFESRGWFFIHGTDIYGCIYLSHSISNVRFDLPNLIDNIDGSSVQIRPVFISKAILSTHNIKSSDFCIFIVYAGKLCGWRPGAVTWTEYELPFEHCKDVAYNNERLYVLRGCTVARCKIEGLRLVVCEQVILQEPNICCSLYLVEPLNTDLDSLLVVFHYLPCGSRTRFYVFEVDLRKGTFKEVNNLGDGAIFFGGNYYTNYYIKNGSMLAKALGVKGTSPTNSIYFMVGNYSLQYSNYNDSLSSSLLLPVYNSMFNSNFIECPRKDGLDLFYYNLGDRSFNLCMGGLLSHRIDCLFDRLMFVTPKFN